jgi:hypothetical protein
VRSSTIRTGQGAEVIVPNSKLAQEQLTNSTLSDRTRPYEIPYPPRDVYIRYAPDAASATVEMSWTATSGGGD